ncbi:hypothetical protein BJ944DRAFT_269975 [Cunninghamella echinulata]|nr:hypothetical protein BJ944DRAFT_269975 [Cunninghamella echinulata]
MSYNFPTGDEVINEEEIEQQQQSDEVIGQEEEEEETIEQGAIDITEQDHIGETLDQALDALQQDAPEFINKDLPTMASSPHIQSANHDQHQPSSIGSNNDDISVEDKSLWLFIAIVILICFRISHVKRFLLKLVKGPESSSNLPYYNKELD